MIEFVVGLFLLGLLGIAILCLFSIPIAILMGLRWDSLAVKIIQWTLGALVFAILGGLAYIGEYPLSEWGELMHALYLAGIGLTSFLLCAGVGYGTLTIGEKIWKRLKKEKTK